MTAVFRGPSGILVPGPRLGRGGEGEVFALADGSPRAIKIYASPDAAREAKILSMAAARLGPLCPGVAFPDEAAYARDGSFAGFVMPLVADGHPVHELCSPGSRRREFPGADWRFLVRTALNTARVVERIHATGAVIGDLNGSGVLVSQRAVVSLIDADSFQWGEDHLCRVGVPEFTPPELHGRTLDGVVRTVQHDSFGLAVLLFQLLFLGRHPHAGVPRHRELPLVDAIVQNCFAYSRIRSVRLAPPGGTLMLTDLPLGLATLFERAFAGVGPRPLPRDWIGELEILETEIAPCDRKEGHHRPTRRGGCPWCRIERDTGSPTFGSGASAASLPRAAAPVASAILEVRRVLSRAARETGEGVRPPAASEPAAPGDAAIRTLDRDGRPGAQTAKQFVAAHRKARRDLDRTVDVWRNRVGAWTVAKSAGDLAAALARHDATAFDHDAALLDVTSALHGRLVEEELRRLPLTAAAVPGLGERGVARLASAGIGCAADLDRAALEAVRGMGERGIVALLLWRDDAVVRIGRSVTPDPSAIAGAFDERRIRSFEDEARREERLVRLAAELDAALDELAVRAGSEDRRLEAVVDAYRRSLSDLRHLGLSEHDAPADQASVAQTSASKPRRSGTAACPVCGGAMSKRWARGGPNPNSFFLGCSNYPACSGSRSLRPRRP